MLIPLSYPLTLDGPLYPGTPPVRVESVKSMRQGDTANTSYISSSTHAGTHIDLPSHFCPDASPSLHHLLRPEMIFYPAYCIDVPATGDEPITVAAVDAAARGTEDAQALLVRCGAGKARSTDPETYAGVHPWVQPLLPRHLRSTHPHLALFGVDSISIASPLHRSEGRESHKAFLCGDHPILILEDADLADPRLASLPFRLIVYPWLIADIDGVPVSALAVIDL